CKVKRNGESVSGFELILGGNLEGDKSSFGRKTGIKFAADDTFMVVESIIESYQGSHYKNFYDYAYGIIYE
ncbi:MAG: nitrite/sulfite reductase, partial [Sulfurimonas sp.]|nr:nitrite/sulfite reductase [Sulfurimonas sp.]